MAWKEQLRLYLCMPVHPNPFGLDPLTVAREAVLGGVTTIQLRDKDTPLPEVLEVGQKLRQLCREMGVLFIVNDRVDVALYLEADGVHLGQEDFPPQAARELLGPGAIIGASASTLEEARRAVEQGADYLGVGAIYATSTKADAGEPVGCRFLRQVRDNYPQMPMVGIGGITAERAPQVVEAGADGVAVISAIWGQKSPRQAAQAFG